MQQHLVLPESSPILQGLSLELDMMNGWMPQSVTLPEVFDFSNYIIDRLVQCLPITQLVYLGPRFVDCTEMLFKYGYQVPTKYKQFQEVIQKRNRKTKQIVNRPFMGMRIPQDVIFDSDFESGNLDLVVRVSEFEYDLFMRVDSNAQSHYHWYYFTLQSKFEKTIKLNICNFAKERCLYQRGMRPYMLINGEWQQHGDNVKFGQKQLRYNCVDNCNKFCRLSFEVTLKPNTVISIAYCVPYTYRQLQQYLSTFNVESLNSTVCGIDVPMVRWQCDTSRSIVVSGRVHPGESNSSYVMEGFMNFMNSDQSMYLRQNASVVVIPMLNPDGVILGNYRTCTSGYDLNRQYYDPDEQQFPTIYNLKKLVSNLQNPYMYLDFHGHSIKKNAFAYGPEYPIFSNNYYKCRILPKLLSQATEVFRYFSGVWRVNRTKRYTARVIMNQQYNIAHCFTIEASNGNYYLQSPMTNCEFKVSDWIKLGYEIGQQVQEVLKMELQMQKYKLEKAKKRKFKLPLEPTLINLIKQIRKDEEEHKVVDEDELLSDSSEEPLKQKKPQIVMRPSQRARPIRKSCVLQEIECRRGLILEPKTRRAETSELQIGCTPRSSSYLEYRRSISTNQYRQCRQILVRPHSKYS